MSLFAILILTIFVLSAILGAFFTIIAFLNKKTIKQSFNVFFYSFVGGIIGRLFGLLIGFIIGWIVAAIVPDEASFLGAPSFSKAIVFFMTFLLILFFCICTGAILGAMDY
jgi:uncharacterized protein YacL